MPAEGMAANRALIPYGMKPPPAPRLWALNWNSSTMMVSTGMATFHQVMPALTLENRRMARKLIAVKTASRTTVIAKPSPVTLLVFALYRPCQ